MTGLLFLTKSWCFIHVLLDETTSSHNAKYVSLSDYHVLRGLFLVGNWFFRHTYNKVYHSKHFVLLKNTTMCLDWSIKLKDMKWNDWCLTVSCCKFAQLMNSVNRNTFKNQIWDIIHMKRSSDICWWISARWTVSYTTRHYLMAFLHNFPQHEMLTKQRFNTSIISLFFV